MEHEILKRAAAYLAKENVLPKMIFAFIAGHCPGLPVVACCRVMKVSVSGFYEWRHRLPETPKSP